MGPSDVSGKSTFFERRLRGPDKLFYGFLYFIEGNEW